MVDLKTAFITGAGSGIGRALAHALAARGAAVYIADINSNDLASVAAELRARQANVHMAAFDVADRTAFEAAVKDAEARLGSIDILFNNAGVALSDTVEKMDYDDLEWLMNINFYGVVYGTKAVLPAMLARRSGHIVNISSLFGLVGVPSQSAYCAAKHAVKGFNESLFYELKDTGVQVHSVHPGGVDTGIVLHGKHKNVLTGAAPDIETVQAGFKELAITTPDQAAAIILKGVDRGQYRILVGSDARLMDRLQRFFPGLWRRMLWRSLQKRKAAAAQK